MTFADRVLEFYEKLPAQLNLPDDIQAMNPFAENAETKAVAEQFYHKFYNDNNTRKFIIGINPGRFGGGVTAIPFTDTKRLRDICGISHNLPESHEPSSVFIYKLINRLGGPEEFYARFYVNSICPLGFIKLNEKGNWVNMNYYDSPQLAQSVSDFMADSLSKQFSLGMERNSCLVLGKKNAEYFKKLNDQFGFVKSFEWVEHPRFIVQYKSKYIDFYLEKYEMALTN